MSTEKLIAEMRELLEKSTPGEWDCEFCHKTGKPTKTPDKAKHYDSFLTAKSGEENIATQSYGMEEDVDNFKLIVTAHNRMPDLLRIIEIQREALKNIGHREEPADWTQPGVIHGYLVCCEHVIEAADAALEAADKIARGEE